MMGIRKPLHYFMYPVHLFRTKNQVGPTIFKCQTLQHAITQRQCLNSAAVHNRKISFWFTFWLYRIWSLCTL